jgi:hypothetical protein
VGGIDPELLRKGRPGSLEGGECLRLLIGPVQREHQLAPQALAERMRSRERLELGDRPGVAAEIELGGDLVLDRLEAELLEPRDVPRQRWLGRQVGKRRSSPELEGTIERQNDGARFDRRSADILDHGLEHRRVDLVGFRAQDVAASPSFDHLLAECRP